jgi:hypothetical protein
MGCLDAGELGDASREWRGGFDGRVGVRCCQSSSDIAAVGAQVEDMGEGPFYILR